MTSSFLSISYVMLYLILLLGWSSTNNNQYRGPAQFSAQGANTTQWSGGPPRPGGPPTNQQPPPGTPPQWDQHRYPPNAQPPFQSPPQVSNFYHIIYFL